ncbi:hypothetical protein ABL840_01635 [Variovorax sp. NFACC27]|uniref:hypothetical protein n=1 Tax=unclassified Variovorax TaxID=663243 RepID=UPI000899EBD5|nr:hypothetical protein SAMN03159371_07570 [Variovorax sp. NFACC28]SEG99207.1 hypothetical protein SAMN03159365_07514 [Variovorax sp. NFACC29]SFE19262.1 hypothetical protein SAMN03159379_07513 [Variovorax sp. NFACC26]SFH24885.1 hypothetical protein SAMN03159447_07453 [Variovorax sp. NFACC27]
MSISIEFRHYLSIAHLSAAALFASQCRALEATAGTTPFDSPGRRQHNAFAVSAVIMSTAFLEATVNELFADCAEDPPRPRVHAVASKELLGRMWTKGIPRTASYPILGKYEIALELNASPSMDQSARPYQDVKLLTELRNALIHFEPETIISSGGVQPRHVHKFEKRLKGKFDENPLAGPGNPFYPDKLLGAGCAEWSVRSAVAFADDFFEKLGIEATYEPARSIYLHI